MDRVNWNAKSIEASGAELPATIRQTSVGRYEAPVNLSGHERVNLSLRDTDHSLMKTLGWQRDYPAVYQDIAHWFVYVGFTLLIGGIAVRRI